MVRAPLLDLEKTLAALVKVARNNESTLSAVDRETIFSGARRLEFLCSAAAGRDPKDGRALSESLTSLLGELREWSEKAKRLETQVAELRWVARSYRDASDEQWGVLEEAKRLNLDISRLPRFESALFRAEAARIAVRRIPL